MYHIRTKPHIQETSSHVVDSIKARAYILGHDFLRALIYKLFYILGSYDGQK